ncbi:low molecular weight phosphatase family protein [Ornithinimicrobium ciconiae]|uniref:Low molecular weight phosphatase family protein n=2 Tax=Ornithinimicrobium ciconiae TaxID=2594265 RepID=A0A516GFH1_9MICO|nr:low molecular weight phosphatase family protein [Ornithinimicrobium ciconiae]
MPEGEAVVTALVREPHAHTGHLSAQPSSPERFTVTDTPTVLFVCIKNAGKSQMAAALMRHGYGDAVRVVSAGTRPSSALNQESVAALEEVGAAPTGEHPKLVDPQMLAAADLVVLLGPEVQLDPGTTPVRRWVTDEPSHRGIHDMERMRLVRDDIAARVSALADELALRPRV